MRLIERARVLRSEEYQRQRDNNARQRVAGETDWLKYAVQFRRVAYQKNRHCYRHPSGNQGSGTRHKQ